MAKCTGTGTSRRKQRVRLVLLFVLALVLCSLLFSACSSSPRGVIALRNETEYTLTDVRLIDTYNEVLADFGELEPQESNSYAVNKETRVSVQFTYENENVELIVAGYAFSAMDGQAAEIRYENGKFIIYLD